MADEETYEAQARDWLDSVDIPPPRLEVAQIVQIGQRQVRRRRLLAVSGTAAALAAVAAIPATVRDWPDPSGGHPAAGQILDCDITELAVPEGETQEIGVTAMDPTRRYFTGQGTGDLIGEPAVAILWQDGEPTYIPPPRGTIDATDVNSHGVVVGIGQVIENEADLEEAPDVAVSLYGWVYSDGDVRELPAPSGYRVTSAFGINEAGDVVGTVTDGNGSRVAVWRTVSANEDPDQPELLPVPDGEDAYAAGIAEDGTVIGSLLSSDGNDLPGPTTAYLWEPNGVGRELPKPPGTTDGGALAMSGEWVIGTVYVPVPEGSAVPPTPAVPSLGPAAPYEGGPPAQVQLPVRWNLRTGSVELVDPGVEPWRQFNVFPAAVSGSGDVLIGGLSAPLLLRGDQWFSLPFDGLEARSTSISADGTTIGGEISVAPRTSSEEPRRVPVVWHC